MRVIQLRADNSSGIFIGWRYHGQIVANRGRATLYTSPNAALIGMESAEKRWPGYKWTPVYYNSDTVVVLPRRQRRTYSRNEVLGLLQEERAGCCAIVRGLAAEKIRTERPKVEDLLK